MTICFCFILDRLSSIYSCPKFMNVIYLQWHALIEINVLMSFFPFFPERGTIMEAVCSLKRNRSSTFENCIICQEAKKADKLYNATKQGLQTLLEAAQSRSKLRDPQNRDAVERVLGIANAEEQHLVWHRSCYASFTSKSHICRLQSDQQQRAPTATNADAGPSRPSSTLRSSSVAINWNACMFCQDAT